MSHYNDITHEITNKDETDNKTRKEFETETYGKREVNTMNAVLQEQSISKTKQEFPSVFRQASKGFEIITGNFKATTMDDKVSIISTQLLEEIIDEKYKFSPVIEEDENGNGYTIALDEIMIFGDGQTIWDAFEDLIDNVIEYTELYFQKADFYRQIPNRRGHYPYLRRLAKFTNERKKLMEVIAEWDTRLQQEISKKLQQD